jgi:hypothetical protein
MAAGYRSQLRDSAGFAPASLGPDGLNLIMAGNPEPGISHVFMKRSLSIAI